MTSSGQMIHDLEERANLITAHMGDIDFIAQHKDSLRALTLISALNGEQNIVDGVKEALRHGENAALVHLLSSKDDPMLLPGEYAAMLSLYALMELAHPTRTFPEEDLWAMWLLVTKHYEPVPHAPYTREQLIQGMQEDS